MLQKIDNIEHIAIGMVARLIPWLAPIPSAYLVGRAAIFHLQYPVIIGLIVAIIIEALGLAAFSIVLDVFVFNQNRRKIDPPAPIGLPIFLVVVYLVLATSLTVIIEIFPSLSVYTPTVFPSISLAGFGILGLQNYLYNRKLSLVDEKAERKAERQAHRQVNKQGDKNIKGENASSEVSNIGKFDIISDKLRSGKKAKMEGNLTKLLDTFRETPDIEISEAARQIGVSRQTVYSYLIQLEKKNLISRNEGKVKVL